MYFKLYSVSISSCMVSFMPLWLGLFWLLYCLSMLLDWWGRSRKLRKISASSFTISKYLLGSLALLFFISMKLYHHDTFLIYFLIYFCFNIFSFMNILSIIQPHNLLPNKINISIKKSFEISRYRMQRISGFSFAFIF